MLSIYKFTFNLFGENTYLLVDDATKDAAVVDPGMSNDSEYAIFDRKVAELGAKINQVIFTHLHLDHCFGASHVIDKYGASVLAHPDDDFLGQSMSAQVAKFHLPVKATNVNIDVPLHEGDEIKIGDSVLTVLHVPGHTPGGIALYWKEGGLVIVGDSLFQGSIGRTDLGGNHRQLINSIRTKLLTLPPSTKVLSGHGPATTIGYEAMHNPYLT